MELKCLLMWLMFGSIKGSRTEECPLLQRIEFADVAAETYPLGSRLYYECDDGYGRRSGQYPGIECRNTSGIADWFYRKFECIQKKVLLSAAPMVELEFTQKPERETQSPAPKEQENVPEFDRKAFCGVPKTIPHASLRRKERYNVGQVLHFKCQRGYDKRSPTSGTSTCKKVNGKIIWTHLDMRCTNSSSHKDEWPSQIIKSGTTYPSFSSSMILLVTAIFFVLLLIPAIFV
ncbi:interleukin-2 receptor subunit alpha-like [Rhea pennata]|uniref:interleukin-2 receptor subunit alpha-like n=1 Tax=Rhea pennata TaxID=8795 RepID=UPI002E26B746